MHFTVLPHPNCVRLLAAEESPEAIMLVTPLMPDGDLWGLMQYGQTFGEAQVKNCAGRTWWVPRGSGLGAFGRAALGTSCWGPDTGGSNNYPAGWTGTGLFASQTRMRSKGTLF